MNHLKNFRPSGDSVAARLRSTPAELLVEWEIALVELREKYKKRKKRVPGLCVLCEVAGRDEGMRPCIEHCRACPWITFEFDACTSASPPHFTRTTRRRIEEIGRWLKRIRAEIRARGI